MRDEVRVGRRKRSWRSENASGMHAGRAKLKAGGQGTREAHVEHDAHICDAGRVKGQRLVERPRIPPSQKDGTPCGERCGPGGGRAAVARAVCTGRARLKDGGPGARAKRTPETCGPCP